MVRLPRRYNLDRTVHLFLLMIAQRRHAPHYGGDSHVGPFVISEYATASTVRNRAIFRSGGRKLASMEFAASSRNCSSVKLNSRSASRYSPARSLPKSAGSSELSAI